MLKKDTFEWAVTVMLTDLSSVSEQMTVGNSVCGTLPLAQWPLELGTRNTDPGNSKLESLSPYKIETKNRNHDHDGNGKFPLLGHLLFWPLCPSRPSLMVS